MKKIFIFIVFLVLVVINIPYAINFYKNKVGENLYQNKQYHFAKEVFPDTKNGFYNKGNSLYKAGNYKEAISYYLTIGSGNNKLAYFANHNIGNAYYRLGEKNKKLNIPYWKKAVEYYKKAIQIGEKIKIDKKDLQETKDNLKFVLKKMKEMKENLSDNSKKNKNQKNNSKNNGKGNNQQDKNNKGNSQGNKSESKSQKGEKEGMTENLSKNSQRSKKDSEGQNKSGQHNKKSTNKLQQQKGQNGEKKDSETNSNGEKSIGNNYEESSKNHNLSPDNQKSELEKAIEDYEQQLQKEQVQNMKNYNKKYQSRQLNDFYDPFFDDDPFFMGIPKERDNIKDW